MGPMMATISKKNMLQLVQLVGWSEFFDGL